MTFTHTGADLDARFDQLVAAFEAKSADATWGRSEIQHSPAMHGYRNPFGDWVDRSWRQSWRIIYRDSTGQVVSWGTVIGRTKAEACRWLLNYFRWWGTAPGRPARSAPSDSGIQYPRAA